MLEAVEVVVKLLVITVVVSMDVCGMFVCRGIGRLFVYIQFICLHLPLASCFIVIVIGLFICFCKKANRCICNGFFSSDVTQGLTLALDSHNALNTLPGKHDQTQRPKSRNRSTPEPVVNLIRSQTKTNKK